MWENGGMKMRVAIYGAGSLGTVLGAFLARAGESVDLITRNRAHVEAMREKGAHVVGTLDFCVPVGALLPEEMSGKYDIFFLMSKQEDNRKLAEKLEGFLEPDGVICTFQNGLPEPSIAEVIGPERTFGCTVGWGATLEGPGVSRLTSAPDALEVSIGSLAGTRGPAFDETLRLLSVMGKVTVEENFLGARWSKLLINSAFSGCGTAFGCTFGEVAADKKLRKIVQKVIKECIDVATASGVKIEPIQGKDVAKLMDYRGPIKKAVSFAIIPLAIKKHRDIKPSMLQDIEKGKKCEINAINGVVSEFGRKHGVATPANDAVIRCVKDIENGVTKPVKENLAKYFG